MLLLNLNPKQKNWENRFRKNLQHDRPLFSYHQVAQFNGELFILRNNGDTSLVYFYQETI